VACSAGLHATLSMHAPTINALARLEGIDWLEEGAEMHGAAVAPLDDATVYVPLAGLVDIEEELARLGKARAKLDKDISKLQGRLGNPKYRENAPAEIVARAEAELDGLRARLSEVKAAEERLEALQ